MTAPLSAEEPRNVSVCDIATGAERLNGEMVTIRGPVRLAFEDFELPAEDCAVTAMSGIWLEYGRGPARQPATWCCGDMVPRDSLKLIENRDFHVFDRLLTAQSHKAGCYKGECLLYTVTATITGRVDAVKAEPCPNGQPCCTGGYGHCGQTARES